MPNTISEMMEEYAAEAVRMASEFSVKLDYSESSLESLEQILAQVSAQLPGIALTQSNSNSLQQEIENAARVWGGYLGETIRRLWGGEWDVETYPGTTAPVVSVDVGGAKVFPIMKVYRRLSQGEAENVWRFYHVIREKISRGGNKQ